MKKNKKTLNVKILFCFFTLVFSGCLSLQYPNERKYDKAFIGMNVNDFIIQHSKARGVYHTQNLSIYFITYYKTDVWVANSLSEVLYQKYYYFQNEMLTIIDNGQIANQNYGIPINRF